MPPEPRIATRFMDVGLTPSKAIEVGFSAKTFQGFVTLRTKKTSNSLPTCAEGNKKSLRWRLFAVVRTLRE